MILTTISSFEIINIFYLLVFFLVSYVTRYYFKYFTRPNPLPGPFPLPFLGNAHQSIGLGFNDWLLSLHKKYGDMYEIELGRRTIVLCRADLLEKVKQYPYRLEITEGFVEYGLHESSMAFNNDLISWKYNRQFFNQALMTPSFNNQAVEWANELWEILVSHWNNIGEGKELNLPRWLRRFATDITFKIATGGKNDSLTSYYNTFVPNIDPLTLKEHEESDNLIRSVESFLGGVSYYIVFNRFMRHYFPIVREKGKKLLKSRDYLFNRLQNIVKERRIEIDNTPLDQPLGNDMLTSLMTANTSRDVNPLKHADDPELLRPMTDKEIFGNILDVMLGGFDNTANMVSFVAYHLAHHPKVLQRLQQELDEVLGKDLTKPITYKNIEELEYCDAVIKEVNRYCPVSFAVGRVSAEEDNVGGYNWPKGTPYQMLYSAIMKRKDYWTDPEKFDPDRFYKVEESDKYLLEKQKIKNSFNVFGEGIRMCPGRKLAMVESKYLLASIYRTYDVELVDMNAPVKVVSQFTNACEELMVRIKPRKF